MRRMPPARLAILLAGITAVTVVSATVVQAQTVVTGHYQPLFASGLKSGILPMRVSDQLSSDPSYPFDRARGADSAKDLCRFRCIK